MERMPAHNSTYKKLAVQWLNEAFPQRRDRSCFVSSFPAKAGQVVVADSFVLRNRQLLVAANRYPQVEKPT
jgi:hypothetical protein